MKTLNAPTEQMCQDKEQCMCASTSLNNIDNILECVSLITHRVSMGGNAIASVHLSVRLFPLLLLN